MPQMQADKRRPRDRCYPDDSATSADCLPSHTGLQCRPAHTTDCKPPCGQALFALPTRPYRQRCPARVFRQAAVCTPSRNTPTTSHSHALINLPFSPWASLSVANGVEELER